MRAPMVRKLSKATTRRALYALAAVAVAEIVGTIGFHVIEGTRWVDAFYFESMLATGQGPPFPLATDVGKVFASIMGFVSVGSVLSAVVFAVGPFVLRLWREGVEAAEVEARRLEHAAIQDVRKIEEEFRGAPHDRNGPPAGPPS